MKQITITDDLYDKILKSNPTQGTPPNIVQIIEQLKTEIFLSQIYPPYNK